jgi:hypothetical protein
MCQVCTDPRRAGRPIRETTCLREFGGYGACLRPVGHTGQCEDVYGYRFTGRVPVDRVPVVRDDACRYCQRYRRPCGRHEDV